MVFRQPPGLVHFGEVSVSYPAVPGSKGKSVACKISHLEMDLSKDNGLFDASSEMREEKIKAGHTVRLKPAAYLCPFKEWPPTILGQLSCHFQTFIRIGGYMQKSRCE